VYLLGIHLAHLECGFSDPKDSTSLHLLCVEVFVISKVKAKQLDYQLLQPPACTKTTIEAIQPLHCLGEMHALVVFTIAFNVFFRASELTSSLNWSDIMLQSKQMSITLNQSKTNPFQHGQVIHIFAIQSSTCPIRQLLLMHNLLTMS